MGAIKGLDKLLRDLDRMGVNIKREAELITEDNTRQMVRTAKRFAPVDLGELRNSIEAVKRGELEWSIVVHAKHGPYMEFGTGGLVRIPPELVDLALQFKGKGIREIDIRPQPFLYPAFELQRDQYTRDLEDLLQREIRKL